MGHDGDRLLGPGVQVGKDRLGAGEDGGLGEPVFSAGGAGLVGVDGVDLGEVYLGELGFEGGDVRAGVARLVGVLWGGVLGRPWGGGGAWLQFYT